MAKKFVYVALSLDVEEEGLFSGSYERLSPRITNTAHLKRLEPLLERGIKPTLFCAYSAFADGPSRAILENLRDRHGAEIGAHLHHWNTPPVDYSSNIPHSLSSVPSLAVSPELLRKKMTHLFQIASGFQGEAITSFRMGRWDIHHAHWDLLKEQGVLCDASVRPLHSSRNGYSGPDHFDAPAEPYLVECAGGEILEVPLTVTPLHSRLAFLPGSLKHGLKNWGALALLPVQHPLWLIKLTTRLHLKRGGRTLSLTWHSSEMMPKGSPYLDSEEKVQNFMLKMEKYVDWLNNEYDVEYQTMSGLYKQFAAQAPKKSGPGDWN